MALHDDQPDPPVLESVRKAAFAALIAAQDQKDTIEVSRGKVCRRFHLTRTQLLDIEREGMERQWPPLADADPPAAAPEGTHEQ